MIVVLEGPDGAGKSSLAAKIAQAVQVDPRCTVRVVHTGPPKPGEDPSASCLAAVMEAARLSAEGQVTVFDRLHVGEMVYGPKFRGRSGVTRRQADAIDAKVLDAGGLLVHVTASRDVLAGRVRAKDAGGVDPLSGCSADDSDDVRRAYWELLGGPAMRGELAARWMFVDTGQPNDFTSGAHAVWLALARSINTRVTKFDSLRTS